MLMFGLVVVGGIAYVALLVSTFRGTGRTPHPTIYRQWQTSIGFAIPLLLTFIDDLVDGPGHPRRFYSAVAIVAVWATGILIGYFKGRRYFVSGANRATVEGVLHRSLTKLGIPLHGEEGDVLRLGPGGEIAIRMPKTGVTSLIAENSASATALKGIVREMRLELRSLPREANPVVRRAFFLGITAALLLAVVLIIVLTFTG